MRHLCPRCQTRFGDDVERCPKDGSPLRADPFIGTRIDRWTLTDFVGQGAMGVVYAAEPTAAIKILNARRAAMQPDLVRRFEVEAAAASRFESPHIARVFASGTTEDGHLFIAMELLRGEPLDAILRRSPRLPPAAATAIGHQLAGALGEAHAAEVVHRDLKPANIFVEPAPGGGRHVRLLDFGVARINSESVARSRTGSVAGTPAYMSPEQLRGEPDIDGRSDVYSLGVVLYQLLSGVNPFRGSGGVMGTLRRHLELVPPPIEGISKVLDEIVRRMLAKRREERPQDMEAVRHYLELTGLVHGSADSATIPGMSREFLAAAGVYNEAPDPEQRPLVKKLQAPRAVAQPDPPTATPYPDDDSQPLAPTITVAPGPSASRMSAALPILGLMLLGALAGVGFLWLQHSEGVTDKAPEGEPAPTLSAVGAEKPSALQRPAQDAGKLSAEAEAAIATAREALRAEKWRAAREGFEEALNLDPRHPEAEQGRSEAIREANNERLWQNLSETVEKGWWDRALIPLEEFPSDSAYSERAQVLRPTVEAGYAQLKLNEGRRLLGRGSISGAQAIQRHLLTKPFAADEAIALAKAIERDRRVREVQQAARSAPKTSPNKATQAPRVAEAPAAKPKPPSRPVTSNLSFEELNAQAIRHTIRGDRDAAIVLLRQAARKKPSSHLPHQRLCSIHKSKQQYTQALASCKKWLEREPNGTYRPAIQRNIDQILEMINR